MSTTDLDILLPEDDSVSFTARDGKKYKVDLFIPFAVGAYILENAELLMEIFPGQGKLPKLSAKTYHVFLRIFSLVCKEQFEHMTEEWIQKNISLPRTIAIIVQMVKPIYQYISTMGIMEAAQPKKESDKK
jgi:hypothetical protein